MRAAQRLPLFRRPVLVVWSTDAPLFPVRLGRQLAVLFPDSRLRLVGDCSCFVTEGQPGWFLSELEHFLETTPRRAPEVTVQAGGPRAGC